MVEPEHTHDTEFCKARMAEIMDTRPMTQALLDEYQTLSLQVMAMELKARAEQRRERAYPVAGFSVRWDLRTHHVHLYVDTTPLPRGWVLFSYAQTVRDEINLVCTIQFRDMVGSKTLPLDATEEDACAQGIVGIDRVGAYEVMDSDWIASLGATIERPVHHYCFVFKAVRIEILAGEMVVSSGPGKLSDALRELMTGPAET
jgi:hypothetical protein